MVLKFLKKKSACGEATPFKAQRKNTCDETTSSDHSGGSLSTTAETLARNGKWEAFMKLVKSSDVDEWNSTSISLHSKEDSASSSSSRSFSNTMTPLHLAVAHRPPVNVVDSLITILKEKFQVLQPEEYQDDFGQTPLHIAVANHCGEEVAQRLLSGDTDLMPAVLRDNMDRTPLHVAAWAPIVKPEKKKLFGPNQMAMDKWNRRRVMMVLLEHYPEAAALKDCNGKTPLDYARENGLNDSTVLQLERMEKEHSPDDISDTEYPVGDRDADVPVVFPCPQSSKGFFPCWVQDMSSLGVTSVRDQAHDGDDVSTIGYNEAEMFNSNSFEE